MVHLGTSLSSRLTSPVQGMISDRFGIPAMLIAFALVDVVTLGIIAIFYRDMPDPAGNS